MLGLLYLQGMPWQTFSFLRVQDLHHPLSCVYHSLRIFCSSSLKYYRKLLKGQVKENSQIMNIERHDCICDHSNGLLEIQRHKIFVSVQSNFSNDQTKNHSEP